jgi:hypothetical protein
MDGVSIPGFGWATAGKLPDTLLDDVRERIRPLLGL